MKALRVLVGLLALTLPCYVSPLVASPVSIVPAGSIWKYQASGTEPGATWHDPTFNDSTWSSGAAQLGFGDGDEVTTLTPGIITAYFRYTFDSQLSGVTSLTLRLLRDDGAVVYINGVEVFRNNMPPGPISYSTLATATVGGDEETTHFITASLDPSVLVQGPNVVAVEVHQVNVTSSDLSFDLDLIADAGANVPVINLLATDADAAESGLLAAIFPGTFTFSRSPVTTNALTVFFTISGSAENGVDYMRITNEVRFNPGQAQARIDVIPLNDNLVEGTETVVLALQEPACAAIVPPPPGCYRVGPSNRAEVLIKDANSPPNGRPYVQLNEPHNADVFTTPTNITLRAFAQDPEDGYQLSVEFFANGTSLGFGTFVPTTCPAPFCPYYQLAWAHPQPGDYTLIARATDSAAASSNSAPVNITVRSADSATNVTFIALGSVWKYLDNGIDQGIAWREPGFNDSAWAAGTAQLGYGDGDEATVIGYGPDPANKYITTYFRKGFSVTNAGSVTQLKGRLLEDDAGAVYLNGVELFRSNLPAGPIRFDTLAVVASADNQIVEFTLPVSLLRDGANVVAVEMHQNAVTSSDLSFDLELIGAGSNPQVPPTPDWRWALQEGGPGFDSFQSAAGDRAGNVYALAHTSGPMRIGDTILTYYGNSDTCLAKYNNAGRLLWARSFGGGGYELPLAVRTDAAGNAYVAGQFDHAATFGAFQLTGDRGYDLFLAKVTPGGYVEWATSGRVRLAIGRSALAVDAAGNSVVVGQCSETDRIGDISLRNYGGNDAMIAKFSPAGNVLWATNAGGFRDDQFVGVAIDPSGNIAAVGHYFSNAVVGTTQLATTNDNELFIAKYAPNGQLIWARGYRGTSSAGHPRIAADANGNFYFTTAFFWPVAFGSEIFTTRGSGDFVLVKINGDGDVLWARQAGGPSEDRCEGLQVDSDSRIVVGGWYGTTISFGAITLTSFVGSQNGYLAKFDFDGTVLWAKKADGVETAAMTLDGQSNAYLGGHFYTFGQFGNIRLTNGTDQYQSVLAQLGSGGAKQDPILNWGQPEDIVYGAPLELHASANVSGTFYYDPPDGTVLNAGTGQPLRVTFVPNDTIRFNSVSSQTTINVLPAPLTIRAENKSRLEGDPNPRLTVTYSGFVNNDTPLSLDRAVSLTTTATLDSKPGQYVIIPSGAIDRNYDIAYVNGTLTVLARQATGPAPRDQQMPAIAANNQVYLVVWADQREFSENEWDIYATRVTPDGRVLDPNGIRICAQPGIQWDPAVASDGRDFFVVWSDDRRNDVNDDIYGARVTADGVVLDPNGFLVSGAYAAQFGPSVAFNGTDYLAVWYDYRNSDDQRVRNDIYGARIGRDGALLDPQGIPICTADNMQWAPGVASLGGNFFVAWSDSRQQVRGTMVTAAGTVANPDGLVLAPYFSGYPIHVAANASGYVTVWSDDRNYGLSDFDIFGRHAGSNGQLAEEDFLISGTPNWQLGPAIGAAEDQFLAVWMDDDPGDYRRRSIRGARIGANGLLDPAELLIGTQASAYALGGPAVAALNGQFLVGWVIGANTEIPGETDIVAARVDSGGALLDLQPILISTITTPEIDSDRDGVPDARDQCPETPLGVVVDTNGCSIAQLCACDGSWRNHGEYVTCAVSHAWEFFRAGLMTAEERREVIRNAVLSTCGRHADRRESACIHLFPLTRDECLRNGVQFVISGDATGACVLECSTDLVHWTIVPNASIGINGIEVSCPMDGSKARFYRVRADSTP